ncbi:hypothetical protein F2Q68_00041697 [Brassica cretica]|uniref:Peptidase A1 domain-containing protein n=1 Tax=Brassica cretica TaxID=69181 RepID=A0A8S9MJE5_BRACR|nr:hypothetical protein F2Q68_00041697 [Brassica cretica]
MDDTSRLSEPLVFEPGDEAYFVLGPPWLRRYHTVFDFGQERIRFALAVQ